MSTYDYIIIGAGASGLMLADALGSNPHFKDKKILLLDKSDKKQNDRTWCFWEKESTKFDDIVHKSWAKIRFKGKEIDDSSSIQLYTYKMVRGIDFYCHYLNRISQYGNITFLNEKVEHIEELNDNVLVHADTATHFGAIVFNSIFDYKKLLEQRQYPVLQQHFIGWHIKTEQSVFDKDSATFMDFSIPQKGNTRFMYLLPFSENEALIEYTLFSEKVLEQKEYEDAIKAYIENLDVGSYEIKEREQGNIPMSCFDLSKENTNRFFNIGIAGGWAKASTGYTFYNTAKKTNQLVQYLKDKKPLSKFAKRNRFWYYDLLLLDILHKRNSTGQSIFEALFKKRKKQLVLKFLDEETSIYEDLKIITACPKRLFTIALIKRILGS